MTLGCTTGDIKLTGFTGPQSGRVDICLDGVWGSVCNDGWGRADAAVVCRQLGIHNPLKGSKLPATSRSVSVRTSRKAARCYGRNPID